MKRILSAVLASTAIVVACGGDNTPVEPEPATPDGAFAYVTSSNVSVIDLASNTVTATVAVGNGPWGVAITP